MISLQCPTCDKIFVLADKHAGRQAKCWCGAILNVPGDGQVGTALLPAPPLLSPPMPRESKFCASCGAQNDAQARLCRSCGAGFWVRPLPQPQVLSLAQPAQTPPPVAAAAGLLPPPLPIWPSPQAGPAYNPAGASWLAGFPGVVLCFKIYAGLMCLAGLCIALMGVVGLTLAGDVCFGTAVFVVGASWLVLFLRPLVLRPQPGLWTNGVLCIGIGIVSLVFLPVCIPLLLHWVKREVRDFYGKTCDEDRMNSGVQQMISGGSASAGGILLTALTYYFAANGDTPGGVYLVVWGPILFGVIRFFRGTFRVLRSGVGSSALPSAN